MNDFLRVAAVMLLAINPAWAGYVAASMLGAHARRSRAGACIVGLGVGAAALVAAAGVAHELLDFLEIEPETFRVGAGAVMMAAGCAWVFRREPVGPWPRGLASGVYPLALPLIAGPAAVVGTISFAADEGRALTAAAVFPGAMLAALLAATAGGAGGRGPLAAAAALTGALLVAAGGGLAVHGIRAI